MRKTYYVEVLVSKPRNWRLMHSFTRHADALAYVREHPGSELHPHRIVKVIRQVVFEEKHS